VRWEATYTEILLDDFETLRPTVGTAFALGPNGAITVAPGEVIEGTASVEGSYSGPDSYTAYFRTSPDALPLAPEAAYRVTFDYRILSTPDRGFETLFISNTAAAQGNFLPSVTVDGQAGDSGSATLSGTLGNYPDYQVFWNVVGTGAIVIDNIRIVAEATGQAVAAEDAEQLGPALSAVLRPGLYGDSVVTTAPAEIVDGAASMRLSEFGWIETDPEILPLAGDTYYIVEFEYRILDPGSDLWILTPSFLSEGSPGPGSSVTGSQMLSQAAPEGTFSSGALTADASDHYLSIKVSGEASIAIDNLRIIRQDAAPTTSQPASWTALSRKPYPRLGNYLLGLTAWIAIDGQGTVPDPPEGVLAHLPDEIEKRLALFDIVAGPQIANQTLDPGFAYRMRQENPDMVLLPYRIAQEQWAVSTGPGKWAYSEEPPGGDTINLAYEFVAGLADEWFVRDSGGDPVSDPGFPLIRKMNISEFSPTVNGQTFNDYLIDWVVNKVLNSGEWDGIFFDNLFGRINPHILNYNDPALLNYDVNRNGLRDETPAWAGEMTRAAAFEFLERLRDEVSDLALIMGNTGPRPETALAPHVNGYVFECWDEAWFLDWLPQPSEAEWRRSLEAYFTMQTETLAPHVNILEGCGNPGSDDPFEVNRNFLEPTPEDIMVHRFTLGTALLGDGFYEYDLFDNRSAPFWFDEFSVDGNGVAVEDLLAKGYLGQALGEAVQLTTPSTVLWEENFESGPLPAELAVRPGVSVSQAAGDVVGGTGSLIIDNPDHTKTAFIVAETRPDQLVFTPGKTYVIEYDWAVLETLDAFLSTHLRGTEGRTVDMYILPGVVAGDAGKARFHITVPSGGPHTLEFQLESGGKVAIDNIRIDEGGAGPWRRDFENGLALVNPINRPYTFSAEELAGEFNRTGITRILGTQAPKVNDGRPVAGSLTLQPFDAIILLADRISSGQ